MNGPVESPSLDALVSDPGRVFQLSPDSALVLLGGLAGLLPALIAQAAKDIGKTVAPSTRERWLDAGEVAEILHVPKSWIYESARNGRLKSAKHGKYVRFRERDIREYQFKAGA